jgi:Icc protein
MLIAQISDIHIRRPGQLAYRRLDTAPFLARCIERLNTWAQPISAVVITGDLTDTGAPEEYTHLRSLLAQLKLPYYLMVGNHDQRTPLLDAFPEAAYLKQSDTDFIQYRVALGTAAAPLHLLALDTLDAPRSGGRLCPTRLAWLAQALDQSRGAPVMVALHHPPFYSGIGHMDSAALDPDDTQLLAQLISRYPNVERVICGHLHRPIHMRFAGTIASTAPSPAHQVVLDLDANADSAFVMEPPAFALHYWQAGAGLVSHHAYLDRYDGPYPFHENHGALIL